MLLYNLVLLPISASRLSLSISISSQQCFASFLSCKVISFHLYRSPNADQCHDHVGIRAFDLGLFDHYHETKMKSIKMIRHRSQDVCPWGHLFLGLVSLAPLLLPGLMYRCSLPILASLSLSLPLHWFGFQHSHHIIGQCPLPKCT